MPARQKRTQNAFRNVVEFPRAKYGSTGTLKVQVPNSLSDESQSVYTITRNYPREGLVAGDHIMFDFSLVPKLGDIVLTEHDLIKRYCELEPGEGYMGVIWGFQRDLGRF